MNFENNLIFRKKINNIITDSINYAAPSTEKFKIDLTDFIKPNEQKKIEKSLN